MFYFEEISSAVGPSKSGVDGARKTDPIRPDESRIAGCDGVAFQPPILVAFKDVRLVIRARKNGVDLDVGGAELGVAGDAGPAGAAAIRRLSCCCPHWFGCRCGRRWAFAVQLLSIQII